MKRRLTTILAADAVGYSRLMEANEAKTYADLQAHLNELILREVEARDGQIVKLMGDGVLAEFGSVVGAVDCALEIQRGMARRNADVPQETRIELRIGVHLGDVITESDDLFGDGVNVAARLETLADAGTVCISQQVLDQVETKIDVARRTLGERKVKNLERPITAHILDPFTPAASIPRRPRKRTGAIWTALLAACAALAAVYWQPWKSDPVMFPATAAPRDFDALPALAVLPFENISGDSSDDYLAEGLTDDLITDLARLPELLVISRSSTSAYKGLTPDAGDVAAALGARYIVMGTMRRAGGTLRINAKLVDSETGAHVWAQRYDRPAQDMLALQDDVRGQIVAALKIRVSPEVEKSIARSRTDDPEAYDAFLRARQQESFFTRDSTREAIRYYRLALEHDPDFVTATARLSIVYSLAVDNDWSVDPVGELELARNLAAQAVAKDPTLPTAHWAAARYFTRNETWDSEKAIAALERAISIDPNYADGFAMLGTTLHFVGRSEEGLGHIETAMRLNPNFPFWYYFSLGANQFMLTRYEAAVESFNKAIERNPGWPSSYRYLIAALGYLGDTDEAEWQIEELKGLGFDIDIASMQDRSTIQDPAYRKRFFDGLRKAGVPEN